MNVALIGATGHVGPRLLSELSARGHRVSAITIHPDAVEPMDGVEAVRGDASDTTGLVPLLRDHDVVVSSVSFTKFDHASLIAAVKASGAPRYFVVGGSGTLLVPGTTNRLMDGPNMPQAVRPSAEAGARFLDLLKADSTLNWTFLSPPPGIAPGVRTGIFRIGKDELLVRTDGPPAISTEDFAVAVVNELEDPRQSGRYTVGY